LADTTIPPEMGDVKPSTDSAAPVLLFDRGSPARAGL